MPASTIKCNPTGSSATTQDCTQTQAWTLLGGTSGHVFPLLDGANTWSQIQTLSLSNNSPLQLTGTSPGIELGSTGVANFPSIDWHSSGNNIDYDARLVASGGNGSPANWTFNARRIFENRANAGKSGQGVSDNANTVRDGWVFWP
jgi:hypothetical protein